MESLQAFAAYMQMFFRERIFYTSDGLIFRKFISYYFTDLQRYVSYLQTLWKGKHCFSVNFSNMLSLLQAFEVL